MGLYILIKKETFINIPWSQKKPAAMELWKAGTDLV